MTMAPPTWVDQGRVLVSGRTVYAMSDTDLLSWRSAEFPATFGIRARSLTLSATTLRGRKVVYAELSQSLSVGIAGDQVPAFQNNGPRV